MMVTLQAKDDGLNDRQVLISSTAANMISSLHPFNKTKSLAVEKRIKSSVLDPKNVNEIVGVENAFVARAGKLRVVFTKKDEAIVITSVVAKD